MGSTPAEQEINRAAVFHPQTADERTRPCLEVGGVQVYAYYERGELRIGVHYDDAVSEVLSAQGAVPATRVTLGMVDVYVTE